MPMTSNASTMLARMAQEPLLIAPGSEELLSAYITSMQGHEDFAKAHEVTAQTDDFWDDEDEFMSWLRPYEVRDGVMILPVHGVLVHKMSFKFGSWATGYEYIRRALDRAMADPAVHTVAIDSNSPGGTVAGNFELVEHIASYRGTKPIKAFANDIAFSAAYNIAAAADEVIVSRSGGVGSVGVVTMHVDYSGALSKNGIKVTFIFAGKHKVEGNPYEKLPDAAKARIQERIDRLYGEFVGYVAAHRGMEEQAVRDTEALTYDASEAVAVGFADKIGTLDEEIAASHDGAAETEDERMSFTQEQMDAAVSAAKAEGHAAGKAEGKKEGMTEGMNAERERVTAIMGSDEAKKRPAAAQMMVDLGVPAEKASEQLAKLPEEVKAKTEKTDDKAKGGKSAFELAMEGSGNPQVGADAGEDEDKPKMSVADSIFASAGYAPAKTQ